MKLLILVLSIVGSVLLGLPLMVISVVATHPWLAVGMLNAPVTVRDNRPEPVVRGVPAGQSPRILSAAPRPVQGAVQVAEQWLGVPYVLGGCSRSGVDCSCLVQLVYRTLGVNLPRIAADQWRAVQHIERDDLQPGDLVFFRDTYMPGLSHVGIYVGNGDMINAPTEGQPVSAMHAFSGYWGAHYAGAGRVELKTP